MKKKHNWIYINHSARKCFNCGQEQRLELQDDMLAKVSSRNVDTTHLVAKVQAWIPEARKCESRKAVSRP